MTAIATLYPSLTRQLASRATLLLALPLLLAACAGQPTIVPTPQPTTTPRSTSAPPTPLPLATTQPVSTAAAPGQGPVARVIPPTPTCTAALDVTPSMTEGPYYKQNPPERLNLVEPKTMGTRLILAGYVLSTSCKGIARARVDFWQADGQGEYDNAGYKMRGYQLTDDAGRYHLETVIPGLYPGRTRHIHVKVQAPNQPALTTQLFFPNEASNQRDSIFSPKLVVAMQDTNAGKVATFNFVVNMK
ncbi:Catechol 1,2-dioxygenase [Anaerolineae bacterium]|nr:Catechol 1,2-dioxygenase [Anaerolineae bacterium]